MKIARSFLTLTLFSLLSLTITGCELADDLKESYTNVVNEAAEVKDKVEDGIDKVKETKNKVDTAIKEVKEASDAIENITQ